MLKHLLFLFTFLSIQLSYAQFSDALITVAEKSRFTKTSTHADVMAFVDYVKSNSDKVHVESMLTSTEGKDVPMLILASPKVTNPQEAKATGKPIIYIQGNIHGGEVEGKEAVMIAMREILFGDKGYLLDNQIIIFVPNYNSDGNDKMGPDTRRSQEGSPREAGERRSGGDFDLNRDGMKMEAVETQGLYENMMLAWEPELFVDLHTTNGTWHGNSLTYAPSYHHAGHPATSAYTMDVMLPAIQQKVREEYDLYFDIYGGYSLRQGWPPKALYTYNHHPRYLVNMMGLRNKMAILSETFAHDRFDLRVHAAHTFVCEILEYTHEHGKEIADINAKAEAETLKKIRTQAGNYKNGVRFKMVPTKDPLKLRTYEYIPFINKEGKTNYVRTGKIIDVEGVANYNAFEATLESTVPKGYIIQQGLDHVVSKLKAHGIEIQQLEKNKKFEGEVFTVIKLNRAERAFEKHNMATLEGDFSSTTKKFKKGVYWVDMNQPLANLIFYLLEPQSDDGLATWNYFDAYLEKNGINGGTVEFPVFKVLE